MSHRLKTRNNALGVAGHGEKVIANEASAEIYSTLTGPAKLTTGQWPGMPFKTRLGHAWELLMT
ncbi:MAG: hypothetical protein JO076_08015 [Verrucomicrobia bacterium]|nr:hypothetical protein [Verrucomicrobiota bacterium]